MAAIQSYTMHAGDKLPKDKLQQMLDDETWLTAEECVTYGLADEFGESEVNVSTSAAQFQTAAQSAKGPMARMFQNVPAFLKDHISAPPAQQTPIQQPQAKEPEKPSGIFKLLESMTKMEE